ncbi:MAG: N-acetylmuramoyl-L-alanine amidase [Bacteroidales bacterium]|nr:N-acetylmuramoyl-L-alanine amidase [Bacteroidales bacterium]
MKRTICILLASLLCLAPAAADGLKLTTVVIDAGHGGKDSGAVSRDGKTYEKTLVLDIAKTLRDKIRAAYPDVNVILTRSTDTYVTLGDRADIANKANANLFISIHINSVDKTSPNGFSVHVLGQSSRKGTDLYANNMDIVRRENSVILLEDDYTTTYGDFDPSDPESYIFMNLMQNANLEQSVRFAQLVQKHLKGGPVKTDRGVSQDPFLVLWRTAMPAVLLELGFISNANDLAALRQQADRNKLAERVFQAFKEYKSIYEGGAAIAPPETKPAPGPEQGSPSDGKKADAQKDAPVYAVQIFAVSRQMDPKAKEFMGYTPLVIKSGKLNKYFIATGSSAAEVRKKLPAIKKKYPDAFLVKIVGETVTRAE